MNPNWHLVLLCVAVIFLLLPVYSYLFYPILLKGFKKSFPLSRATSVFQKRIIVLIAAYNEEKVIATKIESIIQSNYPTNLIEVWVGSDASTDQTDHIVQSYRQQFPFIHLVRMEGRVGKPTIINRLMKQSGANLNPDAIVLMTDANVFFEKEMLQNLVNGFANERVALIGANVINTVPGNEQAGVMEEVYINRENQLKQLESDWKGVMIGPFGACFAIRASVFKEIPINFIVDDFFWCLQVLEQGYLACFNSMAICYEDLPGKWQEEFRRKRRIAYGNFQNLIYFNKLLLKFWTPIGFAFWSHKGIRWLAPCFLLIAILASPYFTFELLAVVACLVILLEGISRLFVIKRSPLQAILYFCQMNVAVFLGLIDFIAKRRKGANWKPTIRNF